MWNKITNWVEDWVPVTLVIMILGYIIVDTVIRYNLNIFK